VRPDKAIECLRQVIEIDPLYQMAYNNLAYACIDAGDFEKAIWAANKQISLAPDDPDPYDTRGEVYAAFGKVNQAVESYKQALEISPGFFFSLGHLGQIHLFNGDYTKAESCYRKLCSAGDADVRSMGRYGLCMIPAFQGKFAEALDVVSQGIAADRMAQTIGSWTAFKHFLAASILEVQGKPGEALHQAEEGAKIWVATWPEDPPRWSGYCAALLVENGETDRAAGLAEDLKAAVSRNDGKPSLYYWLVMGDIELAKGNPVTAVPHLEEAASGAVPRMLEVWIPLASAYLEAHRLAEAVDLFEDILSMYDAERKGFVVQVVKCHYLLGLAYEQSGWNDKAIEQYEEFLDIWKGADPGIDEIEDARRRLTELKQAS
jgi:tetratricopeptide (TPR) repeat protein